MLVLDVPVHAAHRAKLFAADAADGLTSVELLVVVPGTCRGGAQASTTIMNEIPVIRMILLHFVPLLK